MFFEDKVQIFTYKWRPILISEGTLTTKDYEGLNKLLDYYENGKSSLSTSDEIIVINVYKNKQLYRKFHYKNRFAEEIADKGLITFSKL